MRHILIAIALFSCPMAIIGCMDHTGPPPGAPTANTTICGPGALDSKTPRASENVTDLPADAIEIVGTVRYKDLEGGFYAIDAGDGNRYDPINLPESYKKDGLHVRVTARIKADAMSLRMYGTPIEIIDIATR